MENIIITLITGVVSLITCFLTNRTSKKVDTNHAQMNKALTSMMRNDIVDIYYRNKADKKMKQYERESLDKLYEGYIESGGNSFIHDIYKEMRNWEIDR